MRSKITKLLANIAISLSIFVSSIPVIAVKGLAFDAPIPANAFLEESNTLQQFRASLEVDLLFSKAVPLNDSNQNPRYYYMPFAQGGYLIYDLTEDLVCEFSLLKEMSTHSRIMIISILVRYPCLKSPKMVLLMESVRSFV